jgi:hypothetical protein
MFNKANGEWGRGLAPPIKLRGGRALLDLAKAG